MPALDGENFFSFLTLTLSLYLASAKYIAYHVKSMEKEHLKTDVMKCDSRFRRDLLGNRRQIASDVPPTAGLGIQRISPVKSNTHKHRKMRNPVFFVFFKMLS